MFRIVLECKTFNCDKLLGNIIDMVKQMQAQRQKSIAGAFAVDPETGEITADEDY